MMFGVQQLWCAWCNIVRQRTLWFFGRRKKRIVACVPIVIATPATNSICLIQTQYSDGAPQEACIAGNCQEMVASTSTDLRCP
jgi:hypothetical protein